jgi:hypothetical protein
VQAANFVYGRISSFGYYSAFGLGVFGRKEVSLSEKGKLSATLQFPIVTWLARSPYLVNDDEFIENISSHSGLKSFMAFIGDGGLVTWNKLQTFDLEVGYKYRLNEKFELGIAYLLEFSHANDPRNFLFYGNTLIFSGTFRF